MENKKLHFILSDWIECLQFHKYFYNLSISQPSFFKQEIIIDAIAGNLPYNYWDGTHCNMRGIGCVQAISSIIYDCPFPIRLNCNNLLLNEYDIVDPMNQVILNAITQNPKNQIEIASLDFLTLLQQKYLYFSNSIICSLQHNNEIDFSKIDFIQCLIEDIDKIKEKNKIEIYLDSRCIKYCSKVDWLKCYNMRQVAQYNYSNAPLNCKYNKPICPSIDTLLGLKDIYHFYIPSLSDILSQEQIIQFYIQYFIKEEYQFQVYQEYKNL